MAESTNNPADTKTKQDATSSETPDQENAGGGAEDGEPTAYRPEGLPDHMYGKSNQETIDKLYKAVDGYRKEQAKGAGIPEKIDDYKIDLSEDLAKQVLVVGEDGKDPVFEEMRGIFFEEGISADKALRIASKFYEKVAGMKGDPADFSDAADFAYKEFGGPEKAKSYVDGANAFLTGLKSTGKISEDSFKELQAMATYSEGLKVLNELRSLLGDKVIPAKLNSKSTDNDGEITKAKLDTRVADPRYRKGSQEFDQAFYDDTTKMFETFYAE